MKINPIHGFGSGKPRKSKLSPPFVVQFVGDVVSFKGVDKKKNIFKLSDFKKLKGVPCVYCGEIMLTQKEIHEFSKKAATLKGKPLARLLIEYEKYMKPTEVKAAQYIRKAAVKNPDKDLHELLTTIFPTHIKKLELQQYKILGDINKVSLDFSRNDRILVMSQIIKAKHIIKEGRDDEHFRRNKFISGFSTLEKYFDNVESYKKIAKLAVNMPTSYMSENALIVKYSRRPSEEIAFRLLSPSMLTFEHVLPQSHEGPTEFSNIVLACAKDNSARGNSHLDNYPSLKENLPKYIKAIEKVIKDKKLGCMENYVEDIQNRFNSLLSEPFDIRTGEKL